MQSKTVALECINKGAFSKNEGMPRGDVTNYGVCSMHSTNATVTERELLEKQTTPEQHLST
eukprot:1141868-Pelagomonas_calceolata.AAC.2